MRVCSWQLCIAWYNIMQILSDINAHAFESKPIMFKYIIYSINTQCYGIYIFSYNFKIFKIDKNVYGRII